MLREIGQAYNIYVCSLLTTSWYSVWLSGKYNLQGDNKLQEAMNTNYTDPNLGRYLEIKFQVIIWCDRLQRPTRGICRVMWGGTLKLQFKVEGN